MDDLPDCEWPEPELTGAEVYASGFQRAMAGNAHARNLFLWADPGVRGGILLDIARDPAKLATLRVFVAMEADTDDSARSSVAQLGL